MSDERRSSNSSHSPSGVGRRRSSFVDMFGRPAAPPPNFGPRRLSVNTVGLSNGMWNNQPMPFATTRPRAESISSANSGSVDESPFEEDSPPASSMPTTPFARRMSFGAKALRDARNGSSAGNANGRPSAAATSSAMPKRSSPTASGRGGFDFAEAMRSRAERSSISGGSAQQQYQQPHHHRSPSSTTTEPAPIREMPKKKKAPDAFQERILKGDFYMD